MSAVRTIDWIGDLPGHIRLVDQEALPGELIYADCETLDDIWRAIKRLKVRGAPAIGIAAAYGVILGVQNSEATDREGFVADFEDAAAYLSNSRPTAVNLFWALDRMRAVVEKYDELSIPALKMRMLAEAHKIYALDRDTCRALGMEGDKLVPQKANILTHCNAGALATADYGTALGVIYTAHRHGKELMVYADETRPLLQGARLTAWELKQAGVPVTLISDSSAAFLMQSGKVDLILVGADRIAANGDTANKIGTYMLSVLAKAHAVPFYVVAPISTFDLALKSGRDIPIEERDGTELTELAGQRVAPEGVDTYTPAFDVTPARNITAIVTENGIIRHPNAAKVKRVVNPPKKKR